MFILARANPLLPASRLLFKPKSPLPLFPASQLCSRAFLASLRPNQLAPLKRRPLLGMAPNSAIRLLRSYYSRSPMDSVLLGLRRVWHQVPDLVKAILGFTVVLYLIICVALPLLVVSLPLLFAAVYLYPKIMSTVSTRLTKVYLDHLKKSGLHLSGQDTIGVMNYAHPVKVDRLHGIISRRIMTAFEYNENGLQKMLPTNTGGQYVDRRPYDSRLRLLEPVGIRSDLYLQDRTFRNLTKYEFVLLESDYLSPRDYTRKVATVNVIVGTPRDGMAEDLSDEKIFEELFQTRFDNADDTLEQPYIIEIAPSGWNLSRYIIDSESEYEEGTIIRVKKLN